MCTVIGLPSLLATSDSRDLGPRNPALLSPVQVHPQQPRAPVQGWPASPQSNLLWLEVEEAACPMCSLGLGDSVPMLSCTLPSQPTPFGGQQLPKWNVEKGSKVIYAVVL